MTDAKRPQRNKLSEQEAIERAKQGDAAAFELLYDLHKRRVYSLCLRMTGNTAAAEDLTQETLQIVVERVRARTLEDPRRVFAFAATTARNLALNAARKMLRQQTVVDSDLVDELAQNLEMEQGEL